MVSNLTLTPGEQHPGGDISVSVGVTNTGTRKGDDIVQLYVHPGEKKTVTFTLQIKKGVYY